MKTSWKLYLAFFALITSSSFAQEWTYVSNTGTTFILYGMSFPPGQSQVGYACGMQYTYDADGVIVKTTDGGNNWTQIWPSSGTIDGLQAIWFTSVDVGYACGWNNYFIKTTDGGSSWSSVSAGTGVWYYRDVEFRDANNGIAIAVMNNTGDQAAFITSNGGSSWVPSTSGLATADVMGISYASQNTVFGVGTSGNVYRSLDGGHNWTVHSTLPAMLLGVDFSDVNFGVVGAEEKIFATNNGGSTWTTYTTGYENFYATAAFTDGTAYVGGTDENIYLTTNYGQSFTMHFNGGGSSTLYRIRFTDGGTGFACGSQGRIMKYQPPLEADFIADQTSVCTGSTVQFTDLSAGSIDSWSWSFEGGTPPVSTVPNPSVIYNTPGTFDVELTVTSGSYNSTELKTDYITAYTGVGQPDMPAGPDEVCGSYSYEYTTQSVQYATSYDWQISPASAGTVTGTGLTGTFNASNTWSGTYTVKVRAMSACGPGPWSPDFTGTLYHDPILFTLLGDGAYCEGGSGAEISLDGSETGVSYELFMDNVTTGTIVAGTGAPFSFGVFSETGLYTATGFTDHCEETMVGQIYVHVQPLPGQPGQPQGPDEVCTGGASDYSTSGATNADEYIWTLDPTEAGVISPSGSVCSITWSDNYNGPASLTVTAANECGSGIPSEGMGVTVYPAPQPEIAGETLVCNEDEAIYSTQELPGSSYDWEVTGGILASGAGTDQIAVLWGSPGPGSVSLEVTSAEGCTGTAEYLSVTIDDCTGIEEGSAVAFSLFPNPALDVIHITGFENAGLRIYDILGNEVLAFSAISDRADISIASLAKGVYIVKINCKEHYSVRRLIKK